LRKKRRERDVGGVVKTKRKKEMGKTVKRGVGTTPQQLQFFFGKSLGKHEKRRKSESDGIFKRGKGKIKEGKCT